MVSAMSIDQDSCYRALCARDSRFDGRFYTGVHTTGIYCRPICPARTPKRENVHFYPSAAAAQEAGFRPCLRCRPESAPDFGAWRGGNETVSRALTLIELGALDDEGNVAALAAQLAIGERQLRRLFERHLGASPVAVAQTRRVLLAKQLIHQTALPMTEVALAAGFGSSRRFNESFQSLFHKSPSSLRRDSTQRTGSGDSIRLQLSYRPPLDWDGILRFLSARCIAGVECVQDGRYARTIRVGDSQGIMLIEPGRGDALQLRLTLDRVTALPAIIARVRRMFDLGADPQAIGEQLAVDPCMAALIAARPGLRTPGAWEGFELAIRAVLGQQITVASAIKLAGRLTAEYGEVLAKPAAQYPQLTHLFPRAETLAAADLSGLPMPRARSRALAAVAQAAAQDPQLFAPRDSLQTAIDDLKRLPGIGEWTAQYIAMRELREPDAFPAADVGLMQAIEKQEGVRPSARELLERAEAWRPWRAYAAQHLWASL